MESVILPEDTQLWTDGRQITYEDGLTAHNSMLYIKDTSGNIVAYIDAPAASDSSMPEKIDETTKITTKPNAQYFLELADDGQSLTIVTAVNTDWLLDEYTVFPVFIDPSLGSNTEQSLTAGVAGGASGGYMTCDVETVDCFTRTDAYLNQDYGYQSSAPFFDFQFTQATGLSVGSVTAHVSYNNLYYTHNNPYEFTPIQIMEDCGGSPPDGDIYNLNYFANPAGCTGTPLPQHIPYTGGGNTATPTTYEFSNGNNGMSNYAVCGGTTVSSETVTCQGSVLDWIQGTGPEEQDGIFTSGSYDWEVVDTNGDSLDNGAYYEFESRAAGSAGAWSLIPGTTNNPTTISGWVGYSGITGSVTVPAGEEMRITYTCPNGGCYPGENIMEITPGAPVPTIPGAAVLSLIHI